MLFRVIWKSAIRTVAPIRFGIHVLIKFVTSTVKIILKTPNRSAMPAETVKAPVYVIKV